MSLGDIAKTLLREKAFTSLARNRRAVRRSGIERLPALSEKAFREILATDLGIEHANTVYVASSVDRLNFDFPFYRILHLIQDIIGPKGNVMFPTYPNRSPLTSHQFLAQGKVFDIRRSPSYTGLLSEFARRHKDAVRSLHPTKSVVAIGPDARELTRSHQDSPYPYDECSPYYKLIEYRARLVGIGVWTTNLSFVYTIDDALKENPPVLTYHPEPFAATCIDYDGTKKTVLTYAHNMKTVVHDGPKYFKRHIPPDICADLTPGGMRFFAGDAARLFEKMLELAKTGVTIYPRRVYSPRFLKSLNKD